MFGWFLKFFLRKKRPSRVLDDYEFNEIRKSKEDRVNSILDKISKNGIESLTKEEKKFLDKLR
jgi:hypothetical protein